MAENSRNSPDEAVHSTTGLDAETLDDTELDDAELDDVSGGFEITTDGASIRVQQQLDDAGNVHQAVFPRLTSRLGGSPGA